MLTSSDKHMWSKDGVTAKLLVPAVCCICIASRCATAQSIIFAELVVVETTTDATKEFWAGKCAEVPDEALFIKMEMDGNVDYFKPKERSSFCDMLTSSDKHMWSKDGVTEWRTPELGRSQSSYLGGSKLDADLNADLQRAHLPFWGVRTGGLKNGAGGAEESCCQATACPNVKQSVLDGKASSCPHANSLPDVCRYHHTEQMSCKDFCATGLTNPTECHSVHSSYYSTKPAFKCNRDDATTPNCDKEPGDGELGHLICLCKSPFKTATFVIKGVTATTTTKELLATASTTVSAALAVTISADGTADGNGDALGNAVDGMISPSGKRPSGGIVAGVLVATVILLALVAVYVWKKQSNATNILVNQHRDANEDDDFVAGGGTSGDIVYATPVLDDGYVPAQNGQRNNAVLQSASHYDGYAIAPPPPSGAGSSGSVYYDADPVPAEDIESNGYC
eukprot:gene2531-9424_t